LAVTGWNLVKPVGRKVAQTMEVPRHEIHFIKLTHYFIERLRPNPLSVNILPHPTPLPVAVIA
jgi:hypothetical protein